MWEVSEKVLRDFIAQFLRFPPVTDEDRNRMAIPNKKPRRSEVPAPRTAPRLILNTSMRRRIIVNYADETGERRGKPADVHGIEIRWVILDHYPADLSELTNSSFDTQGNSTYFFNF